MKKGHARGILAMSLLVLTLLVTIAYLPRLNSMTGFAIGGQETKIVIAKNDLAEIDLTKYFSGMDRTYLATTAKNLSVDIEGDTLIIIPDKDFIGERTIKLFFSADDEIQEHKLRITVAEGSDSITQILQQEITRWETPEDELLEQNETNETEEYTEPQEPAEPVIPAPQITPDISKSLLEKEEIKIASKKIGEKLEDDPKFDVYFEDVSKTDDELILLFYHDSVKTENIRIFGDVEYTLSNTKIDPGKIVTAVIKLVDGIVPEFELRVGDSSEKFRFGKKIPYVKLNDKVISKHKDKPDEKIWYQVIDRDDDFVDVIIQKENSTVYIKGVNATSVNALFKWVQSTVLTTEIFAAEPIQMEEAIISLPLSGTVTAAVECPDFDLKKEQCPGDWIVQHIPVIKTSTHINFTVKHFSAYGGGDIEVINVQSYPMVGGNWTVMFKTIKTANLTITGFNGTNFTTDLQFTELKCGNNTVNAIYDGTKIFVQDYNCDGITSFETSKVLTAGKHTLEFKFGTDVDYARNDAIGNRESMVGLNVAGNPNIFFVPWYPTAPAFTNWPLSGNPLGAIDFNADTGASTGGLFVAADGVTGAPSNWFTIPFNGGETGTGAAPWNTLAIPPTFFTPLGVSDLTVLDCAGLGSTTSRGFAITQDFTSGQTAIMEFDVGTGPGPVGTPLAQTLIGVGTYEAIYADNVNCDLYIIDTNGFEYNVVPNLGIGSGTAAPGAALNPLSPCPVTNPGIDFVESADFNFYDNQVWYVDSSGGLWTGVLAAGAGQGICQWGLINQGNLGVGASSSAIFVAQDSGVSSGTPLSIDSDGDGLCDYGDRFIDPGMIWPCITLSDCDAGGVNDLTEITSGTSPVNFPGDDPVPVINRESMVALQIANNPSVDFIPWYPTTTAFSNWGLTGMAPVGALDFNSDGGAGAGGANILIAADGITGLASNWYTIANGAGEVGTGAATWNGAAFPPPAGTPVGVSDITILDCKGAGLGTSRGFAITFDASPGTLQTVIQEFDVGTGGTGFIGTAIGPPTLLGLVGTGAFEAIYADNINCNLYIIDTNGIEYNVVPNVGIGSGTAAPGLALNPLAPCPVTAPGIDFVESADFNSYDNQVWYVDSSGALYTGTFWGGPGLGICNWGLINWGSLGVVARNSGLAVIQDWAVGGGVPADTDGDGLHDVSENFVDSTGMWGCVFFQDCDAGGRWDLTEIITDITSMLNGADDLVFAEICNDGIDNDGDLLVDCQDPNCIGQMGPPPPPGGGICELPEASCADLYDNDGDGVIDCNDSDCTASPACGNSPPTQSPPRAGAHEPIGIYADANLITYWQFEKGSDKISKAIDKIGGFNGTPQGGVINTDEGGIGNAYLFDGANDFINMSTVGIDIGSSFTITGWIKAKQERSNYHVILSKGPKNTGHYEVYLATGTGELKFYSNDIGDLGSGQIVDDDTWHHFGIAYNGSTMNFYIDGSNVSSSAASGTITTENEIFYIGRQTDTGGAAMYFNGTIDEVMMFTRPLSASEINQIYQHGNRNAATIYAYSNQDLGGSAVNVTDADGDNVTMNYNWIKNGNSITVLNMPFESNVSNLSAGKVREYSGYNNNGTLGGGVAANAPTWTSLGRNGSTGAYDFDGVNDYIRIADNSTLEGMSRLTIDFWMNADTLDDWAKPLAKFNWVGSANGSYLFQITGLPVTPDLLNFDVYDENGNSNSLTTTSPLTTNRWYHVAGVMNGTHVLLYIDGKLNSTMSFSGNTIYNSAWDLTIGSGLMSGSPANFFNGTVDEVRIQDIALSAQQIKAHYDLEYNRIVKEETSVGDIWSVKTTPLDNKPNTPGPTLQSNNVTINNSHPTIGQVILNSTNGTNTVAENLTANVINATDADNDTVQLIYDWFREGRSFAVLNMPFETNSPTTAKDYTQFGNNGAVNGAAWTSSGKKGAAYGFDGLNDYIEVNPSTLNQSFSEFTVSLWVNLTSNIFPHLQRFILGKMGGAGNRGWQIAINNNTGTVTVVLFNSSAGAGTSITSIGSISANSWNHIAFVFKGGQYQQIYINGALDNSGTTLNLLNGINAQPFRIGDRGDGSPGLFDGKIDEVIIYDTALTPQQINAQANLLYNTTVSQQLNKGEVWHVRVTPNDNQPGSDGNTTGSGGVQIGNEPTQQPPNLISVPLGIFGNNEDLITQPQFVQDIDGDNVTNITVYFVNSLPWAELVMPFEPLRGKHKTNITGEVLGMYFENNTIDFSGNGNNGTLVGPAYTTAGKVGGAYNYDGVNDYIYVNDAPSLNPSDVTVEAWININGSTGSAQTIVRKMCGATGGYALTLNSNATKIEAFVRDNTGALIFASAAGATKTLQFNKWYHVAMTYDQFGGLLTTYINGVPDQFVAAVPNPLGTDTGQLGIGGYPSTCPSSGWTRFFNGTIDEVNVINRSLQQKEILRIHSLGRNSSIDAVDYSDNRNHGIVFGANDTTNGILGGAKVFDGSNDYIEASDSATLNITGNLSLEAWINPRTGNGYIIDKGQSAGSPPGHNYALYLSSSKVVFLISPPGLGASTPVVSNSNITLNNWTHIVATYNSSNNNMQIYLNGVLDNSGIRGPPPTFAVPLRIGVSGASTSYFNGTIDEIRIYDQTLAAGQVQDNYNSANPNYYRIDSSSTKQFENWMACVTGNDGNESGFRECSPTQFIQGNVELNCTNCIDDDGDGLIDCKDQNCWGQPTCILPLPLTPEPTSDSLGLYGAGNLNAQTLRIGGDTALCGPGTVPVSNCLGTAVNMQLVDSDTVSAYVGGIDITEARFLEANGTHFCVVRYNLGPGSCTLAPLPLPIGLVSGAIPPFFGIFPYTGPQLSFAEEVFVSGAAVQSNTMVADGITGLIDVSGFSVGGVGAPYIYDPASCPPFGVVADKIEAAEAAVQGRLNPNVNNHTIMVVDSSANQIVELDDTPNWGVPVPGAVVCLQSSGAPPPMLAPWTGFRQHNNQNSSPNTFVDPGGNIFPRAETDVTLIDSFGTTYWINLAGAFSGPPVNTMTGGMLGMFSWGNRNDPINPATTHPGWVWLTSLVIDPFPFLLTGDPDLDGLLAGLELFYAALLNVLDTDSGGVGDGVEHLNNLEPLNPNDDNCTGAGAANVSIVTPQPNILVTDFKLNFQSFTGAFETLNGSCTNCTFNQQNQCQIEQEVITGNGTYNMTINLSGSPVNMNLSLICTSYAYAVNVLGASNCSGSNDTSYACTNWTGGNLTVINLSNSGNFNGSVYLGNITPTSNCSSVVCYLNGTWGIGDAQNFTIYKQFTVSDGNTSATNPNGTIQFSALKQVFIQTFNPNINVLDFRLAFQKFSGYFDTTRNICTNCTYHNGLGNTSGQAGICQAEFEKVGGMYPKYNLTINISIGSVINLTQLLMECKTAYQAVTSSLGACNQSAWWPVNHTENTHLHMNWTTTINQSWNITNGIAINLTNRTGISIPLGIMTPQPGGEMIACELTGIWQQGNSQNFTVNKSITATGMH